ncbi:hypothetical protein Tco_0059352 [Tanacetum coccineum]
MAISSSSSSSSSDNEVQNCSKQCLESFKTLQKNFDSEREKHSRARLEIQGYELALESLESRILGHEKNELAWGEKYEFQNYELKCREIKINNLKMELEKVVKERDELKVKIEKWEESSKGLNKLLNSQMSAKDKNGLGYGTQLDEMSNKSETDSEISLSVFEVRSSDEEITPANDRFSKADGYHVVPPPITGNFLTPRADISFAGLDEYAIRKKIIESKTTKLNTDTSKSKTSETVGKTNEVNIEKPKSVHESVVSKPKINRDKVIIEDWNSDDEDDVSEVNTVNLVKTNETQTVKTQVDKIGQISQKEGIGFKKIKACFVCKSTDHLIKDCDFYAKKSPEPKLKTVVNTGQRVVKPVWDNAKRVNHQKFSNKLKYPLAKRTFVPLGVLTKTGLVNPVRTNGKRAVHTVSSARPFAPKIAQTGSAIRPIYPRMDNVRPRASYSPIKRSYYTKLTFRPKNLKQDVKTFGVKNMTTAGTRVVVNTGKGKMNNALKKSRATYGAELVSATSLVNTARTTLSINWPGLVNLMRLGKFGATRQVWCCQANLVLSGKFDAVRQIWCCQANLVLPGKISMANLEFVDQHNMVACLEKTEGNSDFHEIVDFLASSSIHHALTVSPTIYTSYIEQFWNTASSQTVNDVKQINATVDSKAVVVTEASIRSSLLFNDADGTACLTNEAIFQNLALMGYEGDFNKLTFQKALFSPQWKFLIHTILHCLSSKSTSWNEFSTNIASAVICLATNQKFNFSKLIFDGMLRNLDNTKKKFLMYPRFLMVFLNNQIELGEPFNDVYPTPAHNLKVFSNMSRKGVKFSGKVTLLFDSMLVPHQAPTGEDSRDYLEGTNRNEGDQVQTSHDSPLSSGHTSDRAEGALNLQDLSGRKKSKPESTLDDSTVFHDQDHGMEYMETKEVIDEGRQSGETEEVKLTDDIEVVKDKSSCDKGGNAEELVSTARPEVSTAIPDIDAARQEDNAVEPRTPPTTTNIEDSSRPERSILTLKPLPTIDPKDKGKKIARQLQVDLQAEVKRERQSEEEASKAKEREEYTIEERAKFLAETIAAQRKFRAAQRSAEIRSRPQTKSQLRNLMMTYLKNMGGYKYSQLKAKSFEEIKGMYERQKKSVQDFVLISFAKEEELIKKMNEKATDEDTSDTEKVLEEPDSTKVKVKQKGHEDSSRKRPGGRLKMKATKKSKRQKIDSDLEEEEQLKAFLMIVPDEEGILDYEVLEKRFPIIKWESKFYEFDRHGTECIYYRIFRSDGSSRWIKTFSKMVTRTMFNANAEDELWQNQERWNLKSWDLYENCGVHTLIVEDGTEIHMLAERKYPLTKQTLERIISLRLVAGTASEDAYTLL